MGQPGDVLVLDDEHIVCERLKHHLEKDAFAVETYTDSQEAINRLTEKAFDVVVTDLKMHGPTGLEVLHFVRDNCPGTQVIIITGFASMDAAREAEYGGAYEMISKPFRLEQLSSMVKKAVKKARKRQSKPPQ